MAIHIQTPLRIVNPPKRLMVRWFRLADVGSRGAPPPSLGADHRDAGGGDPDDY